MAHLFKQPGSAYWWIAFSDPLKPLFDAKGRKRQRRESTGYRIGHGPETRKARELEALRTLAERQAAGSDAAEAWDAWVPAFIDRQYRAQPGSHTRYHAAWRTLRLFLDERDIRLPRQLTYRHCTDYFDWRESPDVDNGKYRAGRNTAILEMKFLALLMKHAVRENFAQGNPCRELGLKRDRMKRFPSYTPAHVQMIVDGIAREPAAKQAFLWPSFLLGYYHGVRLSETNISPKHCVKISNKIPRTGTIIFHQKGGKVRIKPLHPELIEFFWERRGMATLFEMPKSFAKEWHNFLHRCGLKALKRHACFHSLRVTVNNRLRMAGVPKEIRKAYLSHDSRPDVNALYDRVGGDEDFVPDDIEEIDLDEMRQCHEPLNRTWADASALTGGVAKVGK